jgi:hypothetical protein
MGAIALLIFRGVRTIGWTRLPSVGEPQTVANGSTSDWETLVGAAAAQVDTNF